VPNNVRDNRKIVFLAESDPRFYPYPYPYPYP
jgi:hypothetical protein